ncbi:MAG: hypothetical protein FWC68_01135 [Oscillospiraceae bacterium]|nr:hypothetical protein [Oscillospiraceae bacterium]
MWKDGDFRRVVYSPEAVEKTVDVSRLSEEARKHYEERRAKVNQELTQTYTREELEGLTYRELVEFYPEFNKYTVDYVGVFYDEEYKKEVFIECILNPMDKSKPIKKVLASLQTLERKVKTMDLEQLMILLRKDITNIDDYDNPTERQYLEEEYMSEMLCGNWERRKEGKKNLRVN